MKFDLNDLVTKYKDKDLIEIFSELRKEAMYLDNLYDNIKKHKEISKYQLSEYMKYSGDFLFFLTNGITPASIGIEGLKVFLPIINNLVQKNQLNKDVLERFK